MASTKRPKIGEPAGCSPTTSPSTSRVKVLGALSAVACTMTGIVPGASTLASYGESNHTVGDPPDAGVAGELAVA